MKTSEKLFCWLVIVVWVFASIGSAGYLFYYGVPQFGVANLGLSAMAFPYVRDKFNKLFT